MANNMRVLVGPWGGSGGEPWEFIPNGRITGIKIRSGDVVNAVCFSFKDGSGNTYSVNFGGNGGKVHEIPFADDEKIINISGRFGKIGDIVVVTSLSFKTNQNNYGEYGTNTGSEFSLPVTEGKIIGFYGRRGDYLDSIGVVLSA